MARRTPALNSVNLPRSRLAKLEAANEGRGMTQKNMDGGRPRRVKASDIVTRDYTIHMSKRLYGVTFKNRAPRAVREIKSFASKEMNTR